MRHGFSLIEMMVVVAIVGILSVVAFPAISQGVRRAREPTEVVRLRTFLTESRNIARRANRCVKVDRVDAQTFKRTVITSCEAAVKTRCICAPSQLPVELEQTLKLTSAVDVTGITNTTSAIAGLGTMTSTSSIFFLSTGATPYLDAPVVTVKLVESKRLMTLSIMPASGLVRSSVGL